MSLQTAPESDLSAFLQPGDEEALAVETAVRTAVMSIMKVFLDLGDNRAKRYQLKLAEMEKENLQLKLRLKAAERQLHAAHHITCAGESFEISADLTFSPETSRSLGSVMENEEAEAEEAVEASVVSSQIVSENPEACLDASDSKIFKVEPTYEEDTFWIKNEIVEEESAVDFGYHLLGHVGSRTENFSGQPQQQSLPVQSCGECYSFNHTIHGDETPSTSLQRKMLTSSERVRLYRARIRADPEKYNMLKEKERMRYFRNKKTIADLSEPMKNLKRKAWREASQRHRARKLSTAPNSQNNQFIPNTLHS